MHKRLAESWKLLCILACLVPAGASFAGQSSPGDQPYVPAAGYITRSPASAEDSAYTTPEIKSEYINAIALSVPITKALHRYAADFKSWGLPDYPPEQIKNYPYSEKSMPYTVKGDFNGDGIEDAAITGHNQEANLVLVILSGSTGYHILRAKEDKYYTTSHKQEGEVPYTATDALVLKKKGTMLREGDMSVIITVLKTDGFSVKGIRRFDRAGHTFSPGCTGTDTYEYTGKFEARYLESTAKSSSAISGSHSKPEHIKEISLPVSDALRAYNKDFVLWKLTDYPEDILTTYPYSENSLPYRVSGDFNNDGQEDQVLLGHDKDSNITVALISSTSSHYPLVISGFPCYKLAKEHNKELEYTPTESIESQNIINDGFILRKIKTWRLADPTDDYSDDYKLTGAKGNIISYKYAEKLFKHSGPEDECIDKGFGTPW